MRNFSTELEYKEFINCLIKAGYEKGSGAQGQQGYVKVYHKKGYCMWVTFDLTNKKVWLYEEFNCGGCLCNPDYSIPDGVLNEVNSFFDWWDSTIANWLDGYE